MYCFTLGPMLYAVAFYPERLDKVMKKHHFAGKYIFKVIKEYGCDCISKISLVDRFQESHRGASRRDFRAD